MSHDVLVVGGGPAGAALSGLLARQGLNVLLLDAARFPREKPCGECINPGAVAALHRLSMWEAVAPLDPARLEGWRLHAGRRQRAVSFPPGAEAIAVDRRRFDHALLRWAAAQGARVEEQARVADLHWDGDRVIGVVAGIGRRRHRIPATFVVGADGLRSVVVRRLGLLGEPRTPPRVAFTARWRGIEGVQRYGELHFRGDQVVGIAPMGEREANVTLVMPGQAARSVRKSQTEAMLRWPGLRERFASARQIGRTLTTGPFDQPVRRVWAPGALLAGDAAGYFDPLTGQGIYRALRSAELAASALTRYLGGEGESALAWYGHRLAGEFGPAVRLQRVIDGVVRRPALLAAGLQVMGACPPLGHWLMGKVGDCHGLKGAHET